MHQYPSHRGYEGFLALYVSITWYRELTPEEAFRIISGKCNTKPVCTNITKEMVIEMDKILLSKNFKSWDGLERKFKLDRYTIMGLVRRYRLKYKGKSTILEDKGGIV